MAKPTRVEKALIQFANALINDHAFGGHLSTAGKYLADALTRQKIDGKTTEERAADRG